MGTMTERAQAPARPRRNIAPAPGSYHPANRPRLPRRWWEFNRHYTLYMLRELSSVFIALWSALFLVQLGRLRHGEEGYERFVAAQRRPAWVLFNLIAFLFSLLHSVTWLQLTGIVQPIRIGRRAAIAPSTGIKSRDRRADRAVRSPRG